MKKRSILGFVVAITMFAGMIVMPNVVDAAEEEITQGSVTYSSKYQISKYWNENNPKVPAKEDSVFCGWYQKDDSNNFTALEEKNLTSEGIETMTDVYAKFVPAYVLSIKMQIEAAEVSKETRTDNDTTLRIISSVDSDKYQELGFEIYLGSRTTPVAVEPITTVYSRLKTSKADNGVTASETFGEASAYFFAVEIDDIVAKSRSSKVYARPYWVTMDGTKVEGFAKNLRIEDFYAENDYISMPINLSIDGLVESGIAAGTVEMSYNKEAYQVVGVDGVYKVDTGRLLQEMEYFVDNANGKIVFIGNAPDVDEHVTASGLYANVRFQKKAGATEGSTLNFQLVSDVFCNWNEDYVDEVLVH